MRIGIDFGGTKTEIVALDSTNGSELYRHRVPTAPGDYRATIDTLVGLVRQAEKETGRTGTVGVATPGAITPQTGLLKNCNAVWMNGKPFEKDFSLALGRPVRIENDANCFAVSEAVDGAAAGKKMVFGVILGTGCGGGIAVDGRVHKGTNAIAGEWGNNPLPYPKIYAPGHAEMTARFEKFGNPAERNVAYFTNNAEENEYPGPLCFCGRRGCLETWISGTGFRNDYKRVTKIEKSAPDIIASARMGEEQAVAALDRYIDRLSRALAYVVNILDPDAIVLGGGMSNVDELYERVPQRWNTYIFSDSESRTPILRARYGDSSGVRGAAWLWKADTAA